MTNKRVFRIEELDFNVPTQIKYMNYFCRKLTKEIEKLILTTSGLLATATPGQYPFFQHIQKANCIKLACEYTRIVVRHIISKVAAGSQPMRRRQSQKTAIWTRP